jgi:hypothetical protein
LSQKNPARSFRAGKNGFVNLGTSELNHKKDNFRQLINEENRVKFENAAIAMMKELLLWD